MFVYKIHGMYVSGPLSLSKEKSFNTERLRNAAREIHPGLASSARMSKGVRAARKKHMAAE